MNSTPRAHIRRSILRFWPHLLSGLALIVLAFVSALLWLEVQKRFPSLPPGHYLGVLKNVFPEERPVGIYVKRKTPQGPIQVLVLRAGWMLEEIDPVARDSQNTWLHPINLRGPDALLSFVGSVTDSGKYVGVVTDTEHRTEGNWELVRLQESRDINRIMEDDLRLWLSLRSELLLVDRQITERDRESTELRARIEVLQDQIQKGEGLREHGQEQYIKAQDERESARQRLNQKLEEARHLQERVELAQRVTEAGRLVWLAREVAERENSWLEAMLGSRALSNRPHDFEQQLERASRIIQLKREIALERIRIREMQESGDLG